jgi:hypothetical protein
MMEVSVQMAFVDDRISVRHLVCCCTLLSGRLTLLMRFSVCVNHDSTFDEPRTTLTEDALGANAAAEAGNSCGGMADVLGGYLIVRKGEDKKKACD